MKENLQRWVLANRCELGRNYCTASYCGFVGEVYVKLSLCVINTTQLVNEKTRKWFGKLQLLTSPTVNHSNYRRALATVQKRDHCIPYLGTTTASLT